MPGRHELATSRLSWLAIIPTCLAKIGILVPARGGLWSGRDFASKARGGSRPVTGSAVTCSSARRGSGWRSWRSAAALAPGASVAVSLPAQPVLVAARRVS